MAHAKKPSLKKRNHPLIRATAARPLVEYILESGDGESILDQIGFAPTLMQDPYVQIGLAQYVAMFEAAADLTQNPNLGMQVALRLRPADMGPVGVLVSISPTIRAGLNRLATLGGTLQNGTHCNLFEIDSNLVWSYRLSDATIWPRRQDAEFSLSAVCQLIRQSFVPNWRPSEVHLEHGPNADPSTLHRLFRAPILYHQSANRIILRQEDADKKHRAEDVGLTRILERHIADIAEPQQTDASVMERTRRIISLTLGQRDLTLDSVAHELRMSARSLQRYLSEDGTNLRTMVQQHRIELATTLLSGTDMPLSEIAHTLGYADGTVFWRAFRNWTGKEPSALRRLESR